MIFDASNKSCLSCSVLIHEVISDKKNSFKMATEIPHSNKIEPLILWSTLDRQPYYSKVNFIKKNPDDNCFKIKSNPPPPLPLDTTNPL